MFRSALFVALVSCSLACAPESTQPNVILITLDTTRPDFLESYGAAEGQSPNIAQLARDGVLFEQASSSSAVTPVSHASILTGLYQYNHGLRVLNAQGGFSLPKDKPTLATVLKEAGYRTATIHSAFPVSRTFGLTRDFDDVQDLNADFIDKDGKRGWDAERHQRRSDHTTDLALEFLDQTDEPFFLWLHYWDPHDPRLTPPTEFLPNVPAEAAPEARYRALYAAEIRYQDHQLGRLFDGLRERGLYDNSIVALTSDHGEGLDDGQRDHGWSKHRMVYEEQIWVPLVLRLPDAPSGLRIEQPVRTVDIAPTIMAAAGIEFAEVDGADLRPLIDGRETTTRLVYADQVNGFDHNAKMWTYMPKATFMYCVRDGDWKLTYRPANPELSELFELARDPDELDNRWESEPEVVARLLTDLSQRQPWVLEPFEDDGSLPADQASLEALGYVGNSETDDSTWEWTCPRHFGQRLPAAGQHDCGSQLIPIVREDS